MMSAFNGTTKITQHRNVSPASKIACNVKILHVVYAFRAMPLLNKLVV